MLKRIISAVFTVIFIINLTGCAGKTSDKGFNYYLQEEVTSLDPQTAGGYESATVIMSIFEGLCRLDENGNAVAGIAKSWIPAPDNKSFVFILRDDALWSDGTPITAKDFIFAIKRCLDPATKSTNLDDIFLIKNAKKIYEGTLAFEEIGITSDNDYVISFELESPKPNFPELTAAPRFMPCNEAFFGSTQGRYGLEPDMLLTDGPFEFLSSYSWEPHSYIKMTKNTNYYNKGSVLPSSLDFYMTYDKSIISDPVDALVSGKADILNLTKFQASCAADSGCRIYSFNNSVMGLIFNTEDEYIKNSSLRNLFTESINRERLLTELPDECTPANDIIPDSIRWENGSYRKAAESNLYKKERDDVSTLIPSVLKEIDSEVIPSVTIICPNDSLSMEIVNRVIALWNEKIGSYFNILPLSSDEYYNRIYSGDYQIALYTVSSSSDTPYSFLNAFESSASPKLLNSQAYDTLLHTAYLTIDDYVGLEKYLNNESVFYPILNDYSYFGVSPKVKDINVSISGTDFIYAAK